MPQLLVRDVSPEIVDAIKRRAASNGRSAEAEHRAILEDVLRAQRESFKTRARQRREATAGRIQGDSTDLIREDRDER